MRWMFNLATAFDSPISPWNTSSLIIATGMSEGAIMFNQGIGTWDTSHVSNIQRMFLDA
jgi:Mycoplasma protein of unknown function, DUF285